MSQRFKIIFAAVLFLLTPFLIQADELNFYIDPSYDYNGRSEISAFLYQAGANADFYIETEHYQNLDTDKKKSFGESLKNLTLEFDNVIYPKLTQTFGSEWKPGIDKNEKITVLITRIKGDSGGYFNQGDEYPTAQFQNSNEREMIYLNAYYIESALSKGYLAHEFIHLITFNQKNRLRGFLEEIWLNEMRAEAAITFLGYDDIYEGSNLQRRVQTFIQKPDDSLPEWRSDSFDYGIINLFSQYLIDHYGLKILADSMASIKTGIPSLEEALKKNGYSDSFSQIFTNWSIAVTSNDCNLGAKYCYLNQNLKNLKIVPQLNYLPLAGESTLRITDFSKNWAGNWYKLIGGQGTLKLEFIGDSRVKFQLPYLMRDSRGNLVLNFLALDSSQRGTVYINNFGKSYDYLILIPSIQQKMTGFDGIESYYQFIWSASLLAEENSGQGELITQLLAQIEYLKNEINRVRAQINAILGTSNGGSSCQKLQSDLYYGLENNQEVSCLQQFLKNQGSEIYPEGLITGNFLFKTQAAVIRLQEKYATEILIPAGLTKGTGYVGPATRAKINQLLGR